MTRSGLPQRRAAFDLVVRTGERPDGRGERLDEPFDRVAGALGVRRPDDDFTRHPAQHTELTAYQVTQRLRDRRREPIGEVATELLGMMGLHRSRDDRLEIDLVGWRIVRIELLVHLGHTELADAVADGVVDDRPDRRPTTLEAVDDDEPPQRPGPVERLLVELRREVEELPVGPGLRQSQPAHVVVEVELGVGHPRRWGEATETRDDPLVQARHLGDRAAQRPTEVLRIDRPLQDRHRRATRIEPRVLLDVPHQRFVIGHAVAEAHLPFSDLGHGVLVLECVRSVVSRSGVAVRCRGQVLVPGRRSSSASGSP